MNTNEEQLLQKLFRMMQFISIGAIICVAFMLYGVKQELSQEIQELKELIKTK